MSSPLLMALPLDLPSNLHLCLLYGLQDLSRDLQVVLSHLPLSPWAALDKPCLGSSPLRSCSICGSLSVAPIRSGFKVTKTDRAPESPADSECSLMRLSSYIIIEIVSFSEVIFIRAKTTGLF
jgi:hypothetical protein